MAGSISDSYEQIASTEMWEDVVYVFAGFLLPTVFGHFVEGIGSFNTYDELYGLATIVVAEIALEDNDDARKMVQIGGGVFIVDELAERYDVRDRIQNLL